MRVLSRFLGGMTLLWQSAILSAAQPVLPFVPQLPAVRPAAKVVSLNLIGAVPKAYAKNAVTIEIDASASSGRPAPKLWLGLSLNSSAHSPETLQKLGKILTANGAEFVRLHLDLGNPGEEIAQTEAILPALKSAGLSVVACLRSAKSSTELESTLQRLSAPKYGIVRWEYEGASAELTTQYEGFARTVRKLAPTSPVGVYSTAPLADTSDALKLVRLIASKKIPCDSFAWRTETNPAKLFAEIQAVRKTLGQYPALKGILLWVDLPNAPQLQAHSVIWDTILPLVSGEKPNAVAGLTTAETGVFASDTLTPQGKSLSLRQKLGGVLLKIPALSSVVATAATQENKGVSLFLTKTRTDAFLPRPVTIKIKNLPENLTAGWRVSRFDGLSVYGEMTEARGKMKTVLRPAAVSDTESATELELQTVLLSESPTVLEIRPQPLPRIKTVLNCDRLVCRAGETISLSVALTNAMPKAWSGKAELTGTLAGLITEGLRAAPTGTLTQDKTHLMRYQIKIPVTSEDTEAFVNLSVNGTRSSLGFRILAPVKIALMTPRLDLDAPGGTAEMRLFLANRGAIDLPLTLETPERLPLILAQGKEAIQTVPIAIRERAAGVYRSTFTVKYGEQSLGSVEAMIGVPYLARYAALKPNIDGDLSEWTDALPMGMGREDQTRGKKWRGPTDLSAYAYAKWDESFFYFACAVTDDFIVPPAPENLANTGDSVMFAITPDPILSSSEQGYGANDMEFCFALAKDGTPRLLRTYGTNAHPAEVMDKAVIAVKRTGTRTFYEAAIPWQELGMTPPTEGRKLGFTVEVNDDDGEGRGAVVWSDGIYKEKRPFLFPPLRLVK